MRHWLLIAGLALAPLTVPGTALAEDRVTLGWGRLFDNDAIGDTQDRWHTGSYSVSLIRGTGWTGTLPDHFGDLLEWRLRADTIAPSNLVHPAAGDRLYAGTLSLGVHSQADWHGLEVNLGVDLDMVGPQTGIANFQSFAHRILGLDKPDTDSQIGNQVVPTIAVEVGRSLALSDGMSLRPYLAAQAGVETLVRAGGDVVVGHFGQQSVMLRDDVTGQRYRAVAGPVNEGLSLTLGVDLARVFASTYLPATGPALTDTRTRVRAGMQWQGHIASVFYGATYLSPEFQGQGEGQVIGSLNVNLRF